MGMSIDEAMNNLNGILAETTEDEDSVCYVTENDAETLQVAIDTMRKYQRIEKILKGNFAYKLVLIEKVVKDGKID